MKGARKHIGKLVVLVIALSLAFTMMPLNTVEAYAESEAEKTVTGLGVSPLTNPNPGNGGWCKVYYGSKKTGTRPLKFRVLSTHETAFGGHTLLLECEKAFDKTRVTTSWNYTWEYSVTRSHLRANTLSEYFKDPEQEAIFESTKKYPAEGDYYPIWNSYWNCPEYDFEPLKKDTLFLLDASEIMNKKYGFPQSRGETLRRVKSGMEYWLRSCSGSISDSVAYVSSDGSIRDQSGWTDEEIAFVSPALNIGLDKILFTTLVDDGQPKEYKLTVLDNKKSRSGNLPFETKVTGAVTRSGNEITVPFTVSGIRAANATQISVLVTDKDRTEGSAKILKYGKLELTSGNVTSGGVGTFELPEGCDKPSGEDYYVYVFAEDVNGENLTDYASTPVVTYVPGVSISVQAVPYDGLYDGKAHGIDIEVTPKNATVQYGDSEGNYDMDECPAIADVGEKVVYYKATAEGYDPVESSATIKIAPRPLNVSGVGAEDKVYDRTTAVTLDKNNMTVKGKVSGDDVDVSVTGAFSDKNAEENKPIDLEYNISGQAAGNYMIDNSSQMTTAATISRKPVTVSGIKAYDKVLDGSPDAALDYSEMVIDGGYPEDDLFAEAAGSFDDYQTVGENKQVSITGITLIGSDRENYELAATGQQDHTGADILDSVLPKITIAGQNHVYDGDKHSLEVTVDGNYQNVEIEYNDTGGTDYVEGPYPDRDAVCELPVYIRVTVDSYVADVRALFRIAPKPITVSGVTGMEKIYDGTTNAPAGFDLQNVVFDEGAIAAGDKDKVFIDSGSAVFADANAGDSQAGYEKTVLLSGLTLGGTGDTARNYSLSPSAQVTGKITPRPLTISGVTAQDKVYDGNTNAVVKTDKMKIDNLVAGDDVKVTATGTFENADAGSGKTVNISYELSGEDAGNYYIDIDSDDCQTTATAAISQKALEVEEVFVAEDYDGKAYSATVSVKDGVKATIKYGESEENYDLDESPSYKNAGVYPVFYKVTPEDPNYYGREDVLLVLIVPKALKVTGITAENKKYDGNTNATLITDKMKVDRVLDGDDVSVKATGVFENANAGEGKNVTISYKLSGKDANNYYVDQRGSQSETKADIIKSSSSASPSPSPSSSSPASKVKPVLAAKGIASGKKAVRISWNNVKADRYVIYMVKCNTANKTCKFKKVKTVNGKKLKWKKTNLSRKTAYSFYVVAQKKQGGSYKTIAKSARGYFVTGNVRGGFTNPKALKLRKTSITLAKGKTKTIKAKVTKVKKSKKLIKHARKLRFISNNPSIAMVNAKGKVTGKAKGSCKIYVMTVNGIWKTCKVTVR